MTNSLYEEPAGVQTRFVTPAVAVLNGKVANIGGESVLK